MISRNIEQWHVQYGNQIFQILIRQVPAAEDEVNILKMAAGRKRIDTIHNLITYCENFHDTCILPYKWLPGKPDFDKCMILVFAIPPTAHYNSSIQFTVIRSLLWKQEKLLHQSVQNRARTQLHANNSHLVSHL